MCDVRSITARCNLYFYAAYMPWGLERWHCGHDLHFITFSCYGRRPLLATAQRRDLFLEVLEREVDADPVGVLEEERADELRVRRYRNARSAARSSSLGSHSPASTFARTCSGFVAPAITLATAGRASSHANARSSNE